MDIDVIDMLRQRGAVKNSGHYVFPYTNAHTTEFIDMGAVAHDSVVLAVVANAMRRRLVSFDVDVVIGAETVGRTLASHIGSMMGVPSIWCDMMRSDEGNRRAALPERLKPHFRALMKGKRVAIVDDLLMGGSSLRVVVEEVRFAGGDPVVGIVAVRRTTDIVHYVTGTQDLIALAEYDVPVFSEEHCKQEGPCADEVPFSEDTTLAQLQLAATTAT